jgi:hypothetical protein
VIRLLQKKLVKGAFFTLITSVMLFGSFFLLPQKASAAGEVNWNNLSDIGSLSWNDPSGISISSFTQTGTISITNDGGFYYNEAHNLDMLKNVWWDNDAQIDFFQTASALGMVTGDGTEEVPFVQHDIVFRIKATQTAAAGGVAFNPFTKQSPGGFVVVTESNHMLFTDGPSGSSETTRSFGVGISGLPEGGTFDIEMTAYDRAGGSLTYTQIEGSSSKTSVELFASNEQVLSEDTNLGGLTGLDRVVEDLGCDATTIFTNCVIQLMYNIVYPASISILAMAGNLFDMFISLSISSKVYRDSTFVISGWTMVRDLSNIFFIFILLVAAFKTIFGSSEVKKTIKNVIIIALMINFSLFITRVVIDSSNILAHLFYNRISEVGSENTVQLDNVGEQKALSSGITAGLKVQRFIDGNEVKNFYDELRQNRASLTTIVVFAIAVNLIAAWMFFQVGFMMLGRILGLWLSMILAPLAFIMYLLPGAATYVKSFSFKKWMTDLVKYAFLAPVFLFFIYLIITFINSNFIDGFVGNGYEGIESIIVLSLSFFIIIGIMKIATSTAKDMSGEIGGMIAGAATKAFGAVAGVAGGAAMGVAGGALRTTVGAGAKSLSSNKWLQDKAKNKGAAGWMARRGLSEADKTSKRDFDVRTSGLGKGIQSSLGSALGTKIDFNNQAVQTAGLDKKRGKGGFEQTVKDQVTEDKRMAKMLELNGTGAIEQDLRAAEYKTDAKDHRQHVEEQDEFKKDQPMRDPNTGEVMRNGVGNVRTERVVDKEAVDKEMDKFKTEYEKGGDNRGKIKVAGEDKEIDDGSVKTSKDKSLENKKGFAENVINDGEDSAFKAASNTVASGVKGGTDKLRDNLQGKRNEEYLKDESTNKEHLEKLPEYQKEQPAINKNDGSNKLDSQGNTIMEKVSDTDKISAAMTKFKADYEKGGKLKVAGKEKEVKGGSVATKEEAKTEPEVAKTNKAKASAAGAPGAGLDFVDKVVGEGVVGGSVVGAGVVAGTTTSAVVAGASVPSLLDSYGRNEGSRQASKEILRDINKTEEPAAVRLEELQSLLSEAKSNHPEASTDDEAIKSMVSGLKATHDLQKEQTEFSRKLYIATLAKSKASPNDQSIKVELADVNKEYKRDFGSSERTEEKLGQFRSYQKDLKNNSEVFGGGGKGKKSKAKGDEPEEKEA